MYIVDTTHRGKTYSSWYLFNVRHNLKHAFPPTSVEYIVWRYQGSFCVRDELDARLKPNTSWRTSSGKNSNSNRYCIVKQGETHLPKGRKTDISHWIFRGLHLFLQPLILTNRSLSSSCESAFNQKAMSLGGNGLYIALYVIKSRRPGWSSDHTPQSSIQTFQAMRLEIQSWRSVSYRRQSTLSTSEWLIWGSDPKLQEDLTNETCPIKSHYRHRLADASFIQDIQDIVGLRSNILGENERTKALPSKSRLSCLFSKLESLSWYARCWLISSKAGLRLQWTWYD